MMEGWRVRRKKGDGETGSREKEERQEGRE